MSDDKNAAAPPPAATGAQEPAGPAGGDDLRSMITGALAESLNTEGEGDEKPRRGRPARARDPDQGEPPAAPSGPPAREPPAAPAGEPPKPGAGEPPAGEQPAPSGTPPGGSAPEGEPGAPAAREVDTLPWSTADKEEFNALPEAARGPFLRMYKRMEGAFTSRLQRGAQLEKDYGELDRTVFTSPQRELITRNGQSVVGIVNTWANIERALDRSTNPSNPQLRNEIIARMIHNYGADAGEIARLLHQLRGFPAQQGGDQPPAPNGGAAPAAPTNGAGAAPTNGAGAAPPTALEQRLAALETDYSTRVASEAQTRRAEVERQIAEFANAKGADGALAHPFFAEVEPDMAILAQLDRAQGQNPVIKDLYDRAVWARPSTREKLLTSQREAEAKRAAEERKAKADAAKRAGVSVNGAPGPGAAAQKVPDRSLRDEIAAQVRDAERR